MRRRSISVTLCAAMLFTLLALPAGARAPSPADRQSGQVRGLTADVSAAEGATISWRPPRLGGAVEGYRVRIRAAIPRHAYRADAAQARVVGGEDISIDRAPWQVMLGQVSRRHPVVPARSFCGGTLIHQRWVLTAAHCVDPDRFGRLRVASGVDDLDDLGEADLVSVRRIVVPQPGDEGLPSVSSEAYQDIALLELAAPAPGGVPIAIDRSTSTRAGQEAFVSGWGSTRPFDPDAPTPFLRSRQLQGAHIAVTNDPGEPCGRVLDRLPDIGYDERIHVCAAVDGRIAACRGDSGGPLVLRRGDRWVLGGFASWAWGCALPGFPTVYGRVAAYHDWIVSHVPDLRWRVRNVGPDTTEVTLRPVGAGVRYRVTVEPRTADGIGPRAAVVARATAR